MSKFKKGDFVEFDDQLCEYKGKSPLTGKHVLHVVATGNVVYTRTDGGFKKGRAPRPEDEGVREQFQVLKDQHDRLSEEYGALVSEHERAAEDLEAERKRADLAEQALGRAEDALRARDAEIEKLKKASGGKGK
jgi:hypothetical protein